MSADEQLDCQLDYQYGGCSSDPMKEIDRMRRSLLRRSSIGVIPQSQATELCSELERIRVSVQKQVRRSSMGTIPKEIYIAHDQGEVIVSGTYRDRPNRIDRRSFATTPFASDGGSRSHKSERKSIAVISQADRNVFASLLTVQSGSRPHETPGLEPPSSVGMLHQSDNTTLDEDANEHDHEDHPEDHPERETGTSCDYSLKRTKESNSVGIQSMIDDSEKSRNKRNSIVTLTTIDDLESRTMHSKTMDSIGEGSSRGRMSPRREHGNILSKGSSFRSPPQRRASVCGTSMRGPLFDSPDTISKDTPMFERHESSMSSCSDFVPKMPTRAVSPPRSDREHNRRRSMYN